jgi:PAS domain-containing protein
MSDGMTEWMRAAFEAAPTALLVVDLGGAIVTANFEAERVFGRPLAQVRFDELVLPDCFASRRISVAARCAPSM